MTSELRVTTLSNATGDGPATLTKQHAAKAWLKYAGSGTTFDDSEGVSSATDNGTGDYTENFSNSFDTVSYTVIAGGSQGATLFDGTITSGIMS